MPAMIKIRGRGPLLQRLVGQGWRNLYKPLSALCAGSLIGIIMAVIIEH